MHGGDEGVGGGASGSLPGDFRRRVSVSAVVGHGHRALARVRRSERQAIAGGKTQRSGDDAGFFASGVPTVGGAGPPGAGSNVLLRPLASEYSAR